jgi:hypothetical protein
VGETMEAIVGGPSPPATGGGSPVGGAPGGAPVGVAPATVGGATSLAIAVPKMSSSARPRRLTKR